MLIITVGATEFRADANTGKLLTTFFGPIEAITITPLLVAELKALTDYCAAVLAAARQ